MGQRQEAHNIVLLAAALRVETDKGLDRVLECSMRMRDALWYSRGPGRVKEHGGIVEGSRSDRLSEET
ncbi:hypothetical protein D3C57_131590 [Streptomyces rapamycinicus NRRL 5491]|uniref:Uncharacterized protein n=1 Tax=Streptomyces rapamycinicus (strain ATCC 29253 / DSM 41530 / NRRL 5491 / AYB-994) TaxID=1343740 RepID=A0A3L8R4N9_STRRN|nr:hypothetical protein D3C57_131590 [Streptomyces rapamycinicus NRRL 5491]